MTSPASQGGSLPSRPGRSAVEWLDEARKWEQAGLVPEAIACYESAIASGEATGEARVQAEALRRLAVLRHHRAESDQAHALCRRSYELACRLGAEVLAAEALNSLGAMNLASGAPEEATKLFQEALTLGGGSWELRARVEQNLGILANIRGDLDEALARYQRSLQAYHRAGNQHGCAIAHHNLGMVSADRGLLDEAARYFQESLVLAARCGDRYLQGLCLVNRAEVAVARQQYEGAREDAEEALAIFDQLGARRAKADAYRVLGMMYRDTGRPEQAEARLRTAIDLAAGAGAVLNEAEAARELAILCQSLDRNQEALRLLNLAYERFRRLDACADLIHVGGKVAELEGVYLAVVRAWGRSLESRDGLTFGHCERVARLAVSVARALGMDEQEETTVLLGAYLHDLGKVRVPPPLLHKAGPLTTDERRVVRMHPVWGVELLMDVEFPWDIKPVIRWHHERCDGSGYPDGLKGDAIPLTAQVVGIAEVYDALTSVWDHGPALAVEQALQRITTCRSWWSDRVFDAFVRAVCSSGASDSGNASNAAVTPSGRTR